MKRLIYVCAVVILAFSLTSCRKKQDSLEHMQEPISMESLTIIGQEGQASTTGEAAKPAEAKSPAAVAAKPQTPIPQAVGSKPSITEIQTALQNAGYYKGVVDGKSGPMTKKAISEFQKANGLEADGKVGPKTWGALSSYLKKG